MTIRGSLTVTTPTDHGRDTRSPHLSPARGSGAQPVSVPTALLSGAGSSVTANSARLWVRALDILAKAGLLLMLGLALLYPEMGHMEDKASGLRAITYPMLAFALPLTWWSCRRDRASFPWVADLMVTMTLFTDILGNRMNLFDTLEGFDDWVHVLNPGLLTAAVILSSVPPSATLAATLERALAFGMSAAVAWEVAEYAAFISNSTEKQSAYADTLGDLALGAVGAVAAALIIRAWRVVRSPHVTRVDATSPAAGQQVT